LSACELYYIALIVLKHLEEYKKNKNKQRNDEEDCSKKVDG
jgi:hypothetical protein